MILCQVTLTNSTQLSRSMLNSKSARIRSCKSNFRTRQIVRIGTCILLISCSTRRFAQNFYDEKFNLCCGRHEICMIFGNEYATHPHWWFLEFLGSILTNIAAFIENRNQFNDLNEPKGIQSISVRRNFKEKIQVKKLMSLTSTLERIFKTAYIFYEAIFPNI